MDISHAVIAFALTAGLLTITPGLDTALVLRTAAVEGQRQAAMAASGIVLGALIWGLAASAGLGALLAASQLAYNVLRVAGAAYLLYMGGQMLLQAVRGKAYAAQATTEVAASGKKPRSWFLRGMLTDLLNPKVGVFYVTFLPQFVPAHVNATAFSMLLAGIHAIEGIVWFVLLIATTKTLSRWLVRPQMKRGLDGVSGAVLMGFGGLLLARR
ncbi:MAG TPA: LysE family translocator [Rhizomicrobium sp.]